MGSESHEENNILIPASSSIKKQKIYAGEVDTQLSVKEIATVVYPKNVSVAVLEGSGSSVVRIVSLRGNYWKTMGHSGGGGVNLLYLEEALYLTEKHQLLIQNKTTCAHHTHCDNENTGNGNGGDYFSFRQLYEHVVMSISLECYLTFMKLKVFTS